MDLTVIARTDVKDLVIDYIDVITQDGKALSLNWEWISVTRVVGGFMAEYVGVCFGEESAEGKIKELENMKVYHVGLYSEKEKKLGVTIDAISFSEGEETLEFTSVYSTDDDSELSKFIIAVERFLKENLQSGAYEKLDAYLLDGFSDDSGLYDISYDMKPLVQASNLNPFNQRKSIDDYGVMFDDWYDELVEEMLVPFLKRNARERWEEMRCAKQ